MSELYTAWDLAEMAESPVNDKRGVTHKTVVKHAHKLGIERLPRKGWVFTEAEARALVESISLARSGRPRQRVSSEQVTV